MTTYYMDREGGDDFGSDFSSYNHGPLSANNVYSTTSASKYGSNAMAFSGGSTASNTNVSYAATSDECFNFRTSQFTIEGWVYFTSHSATANEGIVAYGAASQSNLSWYLGMNTSGQLTFQYSLNGSSVLSITSAFTPTLSQWYHVAVDRDSSGVIRLYLDGSVVASTTDTGSLFVASTRVYIGNDPALNRRFPGYIQDVRVTKGIARNGAAFTPPTAALPTTFPEDPYYFLTSLLVPGRGDGTGTSFTQRLRTISIGMNSGSTNAVKRSMADGDTVRVKATPDPTLVGNAAWTKQSRTVTLPNTVTALVSDCDTSWTAVSPSTTTTNSSCKTGTLSTKTTISTSAALGKVSYLTLPSTLDLSAYQQISFWVNSDGGFQGQTATLYLCSDTTGDVPVHRMDLPSMNTANQWQPCVFDFKANLGSSIKSVALYINSKYSFSYSLRFDHIIACKASSADDSLTLNSLIGKVCNLNWQASTAYSLNDIRRPTVPNRFGLIFKVTTAGTTGTTEPTWPKDMGATVTDGSVVWTATDCEDNWYAIRSISGTTLTLDTGGSSSPTNGTGYPDATETIATYKREPLPLMATINSAANTLSSANSTVASNPITISGGWDRTNMSSQSGETWHSGQDCSSVFFDASFKDFYVLNNLNGVRYNTVFNSSTLPCQALTARNTHFSCMGNSSSNMLVNFFALNLSNFNSVLCGYAPMSMNSVYQLFGEYIFCGSGSQSGSNTAIWGAISKTRLNYVFSRNNNGYGVGAYTASFLNFVINNYYSENNSSGSVGLPTTTSSDSLSIVNATISESTVTNNTIYNTFWQTLNIQNLNGQDSHIIYSTLGTVRSVTNVRNTASGIAWRFNPNTGLSQGPWINTPIRLVVAQLAVTANTTYNVKIYARRDSTAVSGMLRLAGGQVLGCPVETTVNCDPGSTNTWAQSNALTFTPTQDGVVELEFCVYFNGTNNLSTVNYWIDDLSVS